MGRDRVRVTTEEEAAEWSIGIAIAVVLRDRRR